MDIFQRGRLTRKFERCDLSTLPDYLAATIGNVEDACIQAGGLADQDYTFSDLVSWSIGILNARLVRKDLVLEDAEPDPTRVAEKPGIFTTHGLLLLEERLRSLRLSGESSNAALAKAAAEFDVSVRDAKSMLRMWREFNKRAGRSTA